MTLSTTTSRTSSSFFASSLLSSSSSSFLFPLLLALFLLLATSSQEVSAQRGSNQCEEIMVPQCKGLLPYTHTKLSRRMTQAQAWRHLDALWPIMDMGCANNFRVLACAYYLPKCPPGGQGGAWGPCKETCQRGRRCRKKMKQLNYPWPRVLKCGRLRRQSQGRCVPPVSERGRCNRNHVTCARNRIPICQGLPFEKGSSPNMFLQCNDTEMEMETDQYRPLLDSNCHEDLRFFLCGVFKPFCLRADIPFALPCQEVCTRVRAACEPVYRRLYGRLPWPSKLQCHRYPTADNESYRCVMPDDPRSALGTELLEEN